MSTATTASNMAQDQEIIEDTIYQIKNANGPIRRYVRAVKVYGDKGIAECEICHDRDPKVVGQTIQVDTGYLLAPDQYPKYQFNPGKWLEKVQQTKAQKQEEITACIESAMKMAVATTAGQITDKEYVKRLVSTIKDLLTPIFGSFTLALFIGFVKNKINAAIEAQKPTEQKKLSFKQRLDTMNRVWQKPTVDQSRVAQVHVNDNKKALYTNRQESPRTGSGKRNYVGNV